jgi:hypothetical protein
MIQEKIEQENSNSSIIVPTIQFYSIEHNSQFHQEFLEILFYSGIKF